MLFLTDSIYTERYMNLPQKNAAGYINASITDVTGFRETNFLLAHGSGDDNVHFSNSAHLLDMFTSNQIRNYRFRMFTDRYASEIYDVFADCLPIVIIVSAVGVHSGRSLSI